MQRWMCKGKIHRAVVTEADLNYVGSITIDEALLEAAGILPFEMVQVTSLANGTLWRTYAMKGARGSGVICLNGPPAHFFHPGDLVIILSMGLVNEEELPSLEPHVVFVDEHNEITSVEVHDPLS